MQPASCRTCVGLSPLLIQKSLQAKLNGMFLARSLCGVLFLAFLPITYGCDPGTFRAPDGTCKKCPVGTENLHRSNVDSCDPCVAGWAAFMNGKSPARLCQLCPPGSFSPKEGSVSCTPCPPGTKSLWGFKKCSKCGPGLQLDSADGGCEPCPKNTFSDGPSNAQCKTCPKGSLSKPGSSKCDKCPKGTLVAGGSSFSHRDKMKCTPCLPGTFGDEEGAISCKICPPGTFSERGATECTPCPRGQYAPLIASKSCKPCPPGTDSKTGSAACRDPVRGCTFDTFEDREGRCKACLPGERLNAKKRKCVPCGDKEVSDGGVTTSCKRCPGDKVPVRNIAFHDGFSCICPVGKTLKRDGLKCVPCPQGDIGIIKAEKEDGLTGAPKSRFASINEEPFCTQCPLHFDVPIDGECGRCPEGTYFDDKTCKKCPSGFVTTRLYECISVKTGCPLNQTLDRGRCRRLRCPANTFKVFNSCKSCLIGWFFNVERNKCSICPKRETSKGGIPLKCERCPPNSEGAFFGYIDGCTCSDGFELKGNKCVRCPPGKVKRYSPDRNCVPCEPNKVRPAGSTDLYCDACPKGTISNKERTKCIECPRGLKQGVNVRGDRIDKCVPADPYQKM